MLTVGKERREEENSIINSKTDFCSARLQAEMEEEGNTRQEAGEKDTPLQQADGPRGHEIL